MNSISCNLVTDTDSSVLESIDELRTESVDCIYGSLRMCINRPEEFLCIHGNSECGSFQGVEVGRQLEEAGLSPLAEFRPYDTDLRTYGNMVCSVYEKQRPVFQNDAEHDECGFRGGRRVLARLWEEANPVLECHEKHMETRAARLGFEKEEISVLGLTSRNKLNKELGVELIRARS